MRTPTPQITQPAPNRVVIHVPNEELAIIKQYAHQFKTRSMCEDARLIEIYFWQNVWQPNPREYKLKKLSEENFINVMDNWRICHDYNEIEQNYKKLSNKALFALRCMLTKQDGYHAMNQLNIPDDQLWAFIEGYFDNAEHLSGAVHRVILFLTDRYEEQEEHLRLYYNGEFPDLDELDIVGY
jgi:hypothetical protein